MTRRVGAAVVGLVGLALWGCGPEAGLGGKGPNPLPSSDLPIATSPSPSPSSAAEQRLLGPGGETPWASFRQASQVEGMAQALAGPQGLGPEQWPPQLPDRWWAKVAGMNRLADGRFPDAGGVVPLQLSGLRVDDRAGGNGDGVPNPGESLKLTGLAAPFPGQSPAAVTLGFHLSTEDGAYVGTTLQAGAGEGGTPFSVDLGPAPCSGPGCFAFVDHGQEAVAGANPTQMRLAIKIPISLVAVSHKLELIGFRLEAQAGQGFRLWPRVRNPQGSYAPPAKLSFEGAGLSGEAFLPPVDDQSELEGQAGTARWRPSGAGGAATLVVTFTDGATLRLPFTLPDAAAFPAP